MADIIEITDGSFQHQVLESEVPVLVDLWAEWCGPCHMVTPIVKQLAAEYDGRLRVGKLDVEANPMTPAQYGIFSIPTLLLFKGGGEVDRMVGARPKEHFVSMIERHLD
jgi:thioredoxin 1